MAFFTWVPDRGATKDTTTRVNASKFGDGYEQRVPDGLNSVMETWQLSFTLRTLAETQAIDAFLAANKGASAFEWTNPLGQTRRYKCQKWNASFNHDGDSSLTATLERVFEP